MKRGGPLKRRTPLRAKRTMTPAAMAAQKANSAKRVYVRKGKLVKCESCGKEFYVPPGRVGRARFCSRVCMGVVSRVERVCTICGATFQTKPRRGPRKTCSTACRNEAVSRAKLAGKNPNYSGAHAVPTAAWRAAKQPKCEREGCTSRRNLRQHHVVYEQHVRKRGGDPWDARDSLTLCLDHHNRHHHAVDARVHVRELTAANLEFAVELLGEAAEDYLLRYYDGERSEIARLLERV